MVPWWIRCWVSPLLAKSSLIGSFFADAIFLGIVFHQFFHWWQYSRTEDGWVVKTLVVSPPSQCNRSSPDQPVLLDGLQCRHLHLVSHSHLKVQGLMPQLGSVDLSHVRTWFRQLPRLPRDWL